MRDDYTDRLNSKDSLLERNRGRTDSLNEQSRVVDVGHVVTNDLKDKNVTGPKLKDGAVTADAISGSVIAGTHLANESVDSVAIAGSAVDGTHISDGAIDSLNITGSAIDGTHLIDNFTYVSKFTAQDGIVTEHGTVSSGTPTEAEIITAFGSPSVVGTGFMGMLHYEGGTPAANSHSLLLDASGTQYAFISDGDQTGLDLSTDFTIEAYIYLNTLPSAAGRTFLICDKDSGTVTAQRSYRFIVSNSADKVRMLFMDSSDNITNLEMDTAIPGTGTWYHVAVSMDISAPSGSFYLNGTPSTYTELGTAATTITDGTTDFKVGKSWTDGELYDGYIDELRVWSDIRGSAEIVANYNNELIGTEDNLVAYWKFNNDYTDETSNGNTLTAVNSPTFGTNVPFEAVSGTTSQSWIATSNNDAWYFTEMTKAS